MTDAPDISTFDRSLVLEPLGAGRYRLPTSRDWWNINDAFGGWIAAATGAAIQAEAADHHEILIHTTQFMAPVQGDAVHLEVQHLRAGRKTAFWRVVVADGDSGAVLVTADVVTGERRERGFGYDRPLAEMPDPDSGFPQKILPGMPGWLVQFEQKIFRGIPFGDNGTPDSLANLRHRDGRAVDSLALLMMADITMPRTFLITDKAQMVATISMSTHILADRAEIAAAGSDIIWLEAGSSGVRHGLQNQETRLYRRDGLLLAVSYQVARY